MRATGVGQPAAPGAGIDRRHGPPADRRARRRRASPMTTEEISDEIEEEASERP
jgi:hypothetical protein